MEDQLVNFLYRHASGLEATGIQECKFSFACEQDVDALTPLKILAEFTHCCRQTN